MSEIINDLFCETLGMYDVYGCNNLLWVILQENTNELQTVPGVKQLTRQLQKAWILISPNVFYIYCPACSEGFAIASQIMGIHMQLAASRYCCILLPSRRENDVSVIYFRPINPRLTGVFL